MKKSCLLLVNIVFVFSLLRAQNTQFNLRYPSTSSIPIMPALTPVSEECDIAYADVDGDNDLDLLICGSPDNTSFSSNSAYLYFNDGAGNYEVRPDNLPVQFWSNGPIFFADIDGDLDPDIINGKSGVRIYINDGTGNFSLKSGTNFPTLGYSTVKLADVDSDNDLDILTSGSLNGSRTAQLFINDG
ncbi:MAG: FG-GAP repeat domain-containing protein, partial [Owenweeksia sp.]